MPTEEDRRYLYDTIERGHDARAASILMEYLPPVGWADVAMKSDLAAVELSLRGEMAMLRADLTGEMALLRAEVRSQVPKFIAWNLASLVALSSVILGAAQLLR